MSTHDLPQESELIVNGRKAAYCARRRLSGGGDILTAQDMEDMIQAATMAYWQHHRASRPIPYGFVCTRQAAEYYYRRILGRNPRSPLSLGNPLHDGGNLPHEWQASTAPTDDDTLRLYWLSNACPDIQVREVLEGVLYETRIAADFSNATCCAAA